ncbi:MAG TPA: CDP-alcohol phosphatidyltransferase family protein [Gemmatimonadales bacterium]|nr:CDP-alcohol phosphatidyltransferase family protein [Gemmatimonadales bacterium]
MLATWITLGRLPVLLLAVLALYLGSWPVRVAGVALLLLGLLFDTLDGIVARRTGQTGLAGSVLDIAADRTYELVLWVCFAHLGLIPVAIPLLVIARTTLTDAVRSLGVARGAAPFDQARGRAARFLVGSSFMRTAYAATKIGAFCGLGLAHALGSDAGAAVARAVAPVAWLAVGLCLARGAPVLLELLPRLQRQSGSSHHLQPGP